MNGPSRVPLWELANFLRRRGWLMLFLFVLGASLACGVAYVLPDVYVAGTTIVIERQEVLESYPGALLVPRPEERLRVARTFLTSDTLIRRVVTRLGLIADPSDTAAMDETVKAIQAKLDVIVSGLDSFQLSFQGRNPETVMRVVDGLASEFITENMAYSKRVVRETSAVLADEKAAVEKRLVEYEARIKAFREQHWNELPEQLDASLRVIDRLQARLEQVTRDLQEAKDRVPVLERQLSATPATVTLGLPGQPEQGVEPPLARLLALQTALTTALAKYTEEHPEVQRLRREIIEATKHLGSGPVPVWALQAALDSALARYTEDHPEVRRLRREIREAEARLPEEPTPRGSARLGDFSANLGSASNPTYVTLAASLELARAAVGRLELERSETIAELNKLQARVDLVPRRAQELVALTRDYEALKDRHQVILKKMFDADLSQKAEVHHNDRFRVLDPATLPTQPSGPRRLLIALGGILLAAVLAVGAGWGADKLLDTSFHTPRVAEETLGLPVLAVVATIVSPARQLKE